MNSNVTTGTIGEALVAAGIDAATMAAAVIAAEQGMPTAEPTTAAESLSDIDDGLEALAEEMAKLRSKRVALLPRVSTKEREFLVKVESRVERTEAAMKKASDIKKAKSFNEEDKDQLAAARLEHKRVINEDAVKAEAAEYVKMAYLHSYKLTHRKDGKLGLAIRGIV